jgi:tetratricopeptide (TPR) repeat protein
MNSGRARRQTNQALIRPAAQKIPRSGAHTPSQTDAQTTKQKNVVAMGQAIARRVTTWLSVSNTNRSVPQSPPGGAHSGPSTVLMQASGFKPRSSIGLKVTLGIVGLAVLLAVPVYFILREGLNPAQPDGGALNLISPADQSAQLVKAALSERSQGKYKAAIEHFHHALELTPNNMDTKLTLAQVYVEAGQNDEAAKNIREIIRIQPGHLDARLQLARIYHKRGNWTAAYAQYRYIIEYDQSSPQAAGALAAIEEQKVIEEIAAREAEKARRGRRRLRSSIPSLPVADFPNQVPLLPSWSSEVGRVAPPAALTAMDLEKPDPRGMAEAHKRLGVRYLNIREFNAAINEFVKALNMTPEDKDLCYFIGMAYHGMGRQAEAYNYYMRVDSGLYVVPAESGAKKTRKAAQEADKRRNEQKLPPIKNDLEEINQNKPTRNRSVMNRILDSLR